jgi:integrase
VTVNPCAGIELPAVRGQRTEIPTPQQATALLAALPLAERPLWATALYAGLRLGELRALTWSECRPQCWRHSRSEEHGRPRLARASEERRRSARRFDPPCAARLLARAASPSRAGYVFGPGGEKPFRLGRVRRSPGLHSCRHAYASFMIHAAVNAKTLSAYMGHSSITITIDRYGHLFPGNEAEAATLLDAYLDRTTGTTISK